MRHHKRQGLDEEGGAEKFRGWFCWFLQRKRCDAMESDRETKIRDAGYGANDRSAGTREEQKLVLRRRRAAIHKKIIQWESGCLGGATAGNNLPSNGRVVSSSANTSATRRLPRNRMRFASFSPVRAPPAKPARSSPRTTNGTMISSARPGTVPLRPRDPARNPRSGSCQWRFYIATASRRCGLEPGSLRRIRERPPQPSQDVEVDVYAPGRPVPSASALRASRRTSLRLLRSSWALRLKARSTCAGTPRTVYWTVRGEGGRPRPRRPVAPSLAARRACWRMQSLYARNAYIASPEERSPPRVPAAACQDRLDPVTVASTSGMIAALPEARGRV